MLLADLCVDRVVLSGVQNNPDVPRNLSSEAQVELAGGIPFISGRGHEDHALDDAGVPPKTAAAIVDENADARIAGLRTSLALLAGIACIAGSSAGGSRPTAAPRHRRSLSLTRHYSVAVHCAGHVSPTVAAQAALTASPADQVR